MIKLGFDRQCITPDLPIRLRGFAETRIAVEVHDDLYARCLVFDNGSDKYAFVNCDLLNISHLVLDKVAEKLAKLGIKKDNIVITVTHTHSGPGGFLDTRNGLFENMQQMFGEAELDFIERFADRIYTGIENAISNLEETEVKIGRSHVDNVGKERHDPNLPGDNEILVYEFNRLDGKKVLMYNYACHPTVTGAKNIMVTRDLPGPVERDMQYDMTMFVNGDCGDISTRYTRQSATFEQIEIYAEEIIKGINRALENFEYSGPLTKITVRKFSKELAIKEVPPVEEEQAKLDKYLAEIEEAKKNNVTSGELRLIQSFAEGAATAVNLAKGLKGKVSELVEYSIMEIENTKIAIVPGELFSSVGKTLKDVGFEIFGYGNGYYMYFADENAYDSMFYEAMSSPFAKGQSEVLINDIKEKGTLI